MIKQRRPVIFFIVIAIFIALFFINQTGFFQNDSDQNGEKVWIERWEGIGYLPGPRTGFGVVTNERFVYIIGGTDDYKFLDTVIMARINHDGSFGKWISQPSLNIKRSFFGILIHNNYIYVAGGESGPEAEDLLDSVERAKIDQDGSIGKWVIEKNRSNFRSRCRKLITHDGYIYSVGGWMGAMMDTVERTKINNDGSLGEWIIEDELINVKRYIHSIFENNNRLYVLAGHDVNTGKGISDVEYADFKKDGSLTKWRFASPLPYKLFGQTLKKAGGNIYLAGGRSGEKRKLNDAVIMGTVDKNQPGKIKWQNTTSMKYGSEHMGAFQVKNQIYFLGGSNTRGARRDIFRAEIGTDGFPGIWVSRNRYDAIQVSLDGVKKIQANDVKGAIKNFTRAIALDNTLWNAHFNLGSSYILMGEYDKTIDIMNSVLKRNPGFEDGYLLMAAAYDKKKDINNSLKYIGLAIDHGVGDVVLFYNHDGFENSRRDDRFENLLKEKLSGRFIY